MNISFAHFFKAGILLRTSRFTPRYAFVFRAKDMKEKFSLLRRHGADPSPGCGKESKPTASAVRNWRSSLDALLHDKSKLLCVHSF